MDQTPTPEPARRRTRMTAKAPEDFVAFAPLALGFVPQRSVVMLTFAGAGASFHARVDLPTSTDEIDAIVETLLRPSRRHRVLGVVFLVYDDDTALSDEVAWSLRDAFTDDGIDVLDVLRVWRHHWYAVLPGHPPEHYRGVPYDLSAHPFTMQGVLDGRVTRASRDDVRASLESCAEGVRAVEAHLRSTSALAPGRLPEVVLDHLASQSRLSDEVLAAVLLTVAQPPGRDEAWSWLTREHAAGAVELWSDAVRRCPDSLVASPAAVLAFVAWLAGDGALAWCAVDRSQAEDPDHSLAHLVAGLLTSATSPETWAALQPELEAIASRETSDPAA
jgi:hypothetical protein